MKILITKEQFNLISSGNSIDTGEKTYYNFPYWIEILDPDYTDYETNKTGMLVDLLARSELPIEKDYKKVGLHDKYIIKKADESEMDPNAWYFVLRVDTDPHAKNAALEYARSIIAENKKLALDLINAVMSFYPDDKRFFYEWDELSNYTATVEYRVSKKITWKEFKDITKI